MVTTRFVFIFVALLFVRNYADLHAKKNHHPSSSLILINQISLNADVFFDIDACQLIY